MATRDGGGATPFLAFLIGGLIVAVAVIGYFMYSGAGSHKSVDVNVKAPSVSAPAAPSSGG